jgi:hypothetical protein
MCGQWRVGAVTFKKIAAAALSATLAVLAPATAQAVPDDPFDHCVFKLGDLCLEGGSGNIVWYNRTAVVSGRVWHRSGAEGWVQGRFRAYANGLPVGEEQTRTAQASSTRGFEFSIGDTNLRGGIDYITIQVCNDSGLCSGQRAYLK